MPHLPVILRLQLRVAGHRCGHHLVLVMVVLQSSHGHKRQEMLRIGASWMEKMRRHGRASEQMVSSRIGRGRSQSTTTTWTTTSAARGNSLHSLEIKSVLLQMTSNVFSSEAIHTHELHYGLGDSILDPQVRHSVHKPLVELRCPHQPGPLQCPRRLLPRRPGTQLSRIRRPKFG